MNRCTSLQACLPGLENCDIHSSGNDPDPPDLMSDKSVFLSEPLAFKHHFIAGVHLAPTESQPLRSGLWDWEDEGETGPSQDGSWAGGGSQHVSRAVSVRRQRDSRHGLRLGAARRWRVGPVFI